MNWELVHRINSIVLSVFIVCHIGVHLTAVISADTHTYWLNEMRMYYAAWPVKTLLIAVVVIQIVSGFAELSLFKRGGWRLVRNLSGLYLALFMLVHVGSVYVSRFTMIPTDFYWVEGSMQVETYGPYIIAFYGLGVFSVFAHFLAVLAISWTSFPTLLNSALWILAFGLTFAILLAFTGTFYSI